MKAIITDSELGKRLYRITIGTQTQIVLAADYESAIRGVVKEVAVGRYSLGEWKTGYVNEEGYVESQCRVFSKRLGVNFVIRVVRLPVKSY